MPSSRADRTLGPSGTRPSLWPASLPCDLAGMPVGPLLVGLRGGRPPAGLLGCEAEKRSWPLLLAGLIGGVPAATDSHQHFFQLCNISLICQMQTWQVVAMGYDTCMCPVQMSAYQSITRKLSMSVANAHALLAELRCSNISILVVRTSSVQTCRLDRRA